MHGVTLSRHQPICAMAEYFPDFYVSHDLEHEYENELLASTYPEQLVNNRTNYMEIEREVSELMY